jgi:anti-anti-sigma regulatory factor
VHRACHAHRYAMDGRDDGLVVDYNRLLLRLGDEPQLGGEVDLANVHFLEHQLTDLLADGDVTIDCSDLGFIDAGGCRALRAGANGQLGTGTLTLRNLPAAVQRVMRVFEALES